MIRPRVRVGIGRWGISQPECDAMVCALNGCDSGIDWVMRDPESSHLQARCDLLLHVVDVAGLTGMSHQASWNMAGPVQALRAANRDGLPAIALVRGEAGALPAVRTGCWVMTGTRDLTSAARILAGAAIVSRDVESLRGRRQRLMELASSNMLGRLHRIISVSPAALVSTLGDLLHTAGKRGYVAPSRCYLGLGSEIRIDDLPGEVPLQALR